MEKREQEFTTKFLKWFKHKWTGPTFHFEAKTTKTNTLLFSSVTPKEKYNLLGARKKFWIKFSDIARMGTPFDGVCTVGASSYVVIHFYRPGNKEFFMIHVEDFYAEADKGKSKSLREEDCRRIGQTYFLES